MAGLGRMALAALGILAYQNRDKLGQMLSGNRAPGDPNNPSSGGAIGGISDLLDRIRNAGNGPAVDSWMKQGPNLPIDPSQVKTAIDDETLESLVRQTGMSRDDILDR
nr:DUF937 domain-containing protein [Pseudaminobacter sp.]